MQPAQGGGGLHPRVLQPPQSPATLGSSVSPRTITLSLSESQDPPSPQVLILEKKSSESQRPELPPARWLLLLCPSVPSSGKGRGRSDAL